MRRRVFIPWLLGVAIAGHWLVGGAFVEAPVAADEALTPTPVVVSEALRLELDTLLDSPVLMKSRFGVEVTDCRTGTVVYGRDGDQLFNPASNLKLLTSVAALDVLGPSFRFETRFLTDGALTDGVLKGNLYIRGTGDPELVYEDVWKIVKDLQALGLTRIDGDVLADDSYFDDVRAIQGWSEDVMDGDTQAYNPPLGALSFNFNTVAVLVRPGHKVGAPAEIGLETPTSYVRIDNRAVTGRPRSRLSLNFSRQSEGGQEILLVDGKIPSTMRYKRYYRTITDAPRFALTLFSEMLSKEGVTVRGTFKVGVTPEQASPLYVHYSSSLDMLLKYMNKLSSNFIAEHLVKAMGAKVFGAPGTTDNGVKVLRDFIARARLPWDDAVVMNGSGLALATRVSPHQFVSLLCYAQKQFGTRYDLLSTLPIAGVDGTMRNRMKGTPALGRVRAKTGSVRGVFGFSGILETLSGRELAFSFLVNDLAGDVGTVKHLQDRWMAKLVAGGGSASIDASINPTSTPESAEMSPATGE